MANEDLLSQDEIDALLSGVDNGDVETEEEASSGTADADRFDFSSHDRIVRGRLPTLEMINERFARNLRTSLFDLLRRSPEIAVEDIQNLKFGDYVQSLVTPSNLNTVSFAPLPGSALLVFDPKLVFALVDSFFGGDGSRQSKVDGREFTATETRLVQKVIESIFVDLKEAWAPVLDVEFARLGSEINPQFANIVTPSEVVVISSFKVDLEIGAGELHITIPYSMLEPIRELLDAGVQSDANGKDDRWGIRLRDEIRTASIKIESTLTKTKLSMRQVMNMRPGDVIGIDLPETVIARVGDVPVFKAKYGSSRGNCALRVVEMVNHSLVTPTEMKIGVLEK
ncbi:MAG: flagellar motor switch protein FliM [Pseudomonadota bacterium]